MSIAGAQGIMAQSKDIAGAEMATTTGEKIQKVSAAVSLSTIALFVLLMVFGAVKGCVDKRAEAAAETSFFSELERINASTETAASKSREWLELVYSTPETTKMALRRYSQTYLIDRVRAHITAG
ncbi:MAG: hypothetical protein DI537_41580, partial [Stutzerimonas stutzeri]